MDRVLANCRLFVSVRFDLRWRDHDSHRFANAECFDRHLKPNIGHDINAIACDRGRRLDMGMLAAAPIPLTKLFKPPPKDAMYVMLLKSQYGRRSKVSLGDSKSMYKFWLKTPIT
jgi:hypothetical protein